MSSQFDADHDVVEKQRIFKASVLQSSLIGPDARTETPYPRYAFLPSVDDDGLPRKDLPQNEVVAEPLTTDEQLCQSP